MILLCKRKTYPKTQYTFVKITKYNSLCKENEIVFYDENYFFFS